MRLECATGVFLLFFCFYSPFASAVQDIEAAGFVCMWMPHSRLQLGWHCWGYSKEYFLSPAWEIVQLVHSWHCPPVRSEQSILPCPTGDLSSRAAGAPSLLSEAPPLKDAVLVCGIQMKEGTWIVAMGSCRGNHAIWKIQRGLLDWAKAEMQQQELPRSSLSLFTSHWGAERGKFHGKLLNHHGESTLNCRDFPQHLFPEGKHEGSHKHVSRGASWWQYA